MLLRKLIVGLLMLLALIWFVSTHVWYSPTFRGTVVDENGSPVGGALVFVAWRLRDALVAPPHPPMWMDEAISDSKGEFRIEAWGPKFEWAGILRGDEPEIYVMHEEFLPAILPNTENISRTMEARSMDVSPTESVAVKLISRKGVSRQNIDWREGFFISKISSYQVGIPPGACVWKDVPRFHLALLKMVESGSKYLNSSIQECS